MAAGRDSGLRAVSGPSFPRLTSAGSLRRTFADWSQHVAELGDVLSNFAALVADGRAHGMPSYLPAPIAAAARNVAALHESIDLPDLARVPPADRAAFFGEAFASAKDRRDSLCTLARALYSEELALLQALKQER